MIVGLGIDVVEKARIAQVFARFGDRFVARILTPEERARINGRDTVAALAKYFCAKEAAGKALGTGIMGPVGWHHIVVLHRRSGRPELRFDGPAADRFDAIRGRGAHLSITDERGIAAAVVVLEGE
jgi:holo-[acyl-carrier protein] synthase